MLTCLLWRDINLPVTSKQNSSLRCLTIKALHDLSLFHIRNPYLVSVLLEYTYVLFLHDSQNKTKEKKVPPKHFQVDFWYFVWVLLTISFFFFQLFLLIIPCMWHLKHCTTRTGAHVFNLQVVLCLSIHTGLLSSAAVPWGTWTITEQYLLVKKRIRLHLEQTHNNSNKKLHLCYLWPWKTWGNIKHQMESAVTWIVNKCHFNWKQKFPEVLSTSGEITELQFPAREAELRLHCCIKDLAVLLRQVSCCFNSSFPFILKSNVKNLKAEHCTSTQKIIIFKLPVQQKFQN